ncbi:MAG: SDR family NAD(P)-dependent oxidoreductase [Haliea sp.]|jgi:NAD(P)-dependent dehydrogenase (short-subunit alcohol dehydrogenase family)|nr:SDR family NAD(P)-dependent oxidoreductase [Haliea sp.]
MGDPLARLNGGVAVITGAGSGIGEGLAHRAAAAGMKVVLADIARDRIDKVAADIARTGGIALPVVTDVSDPAALEALADKTFDTFGSVRLLINNAGIETLGLSWEIPAATWEKTLNINIHGVIHGVRAFAPRMIAAGEPAYIANTASIGALGIMPVQTSYILSKHAILAYSECLYMEMQLKQLPIHVSAILPGPVATRIFTDSAGTRDATSNFHQKVMEDMLAANGMTGMEAASIILPQIAAGEFWVSTHADMTREYAANRARHLAELSLPALPPEVLGLLGDVNAR